jgi:transposase
MSMQPAAWPEPDPLVAAAIAAKYQGKRPRPLAGLIRDRLGEWLHDEDFAAAFGIRGRPGWSPSRLALVTILQRAEKLTDRQAAESVRTRIDWQYLLGLPFDDPGFDHTVLPEFRDRVADAGLEQAALDALLERLAAEDLVKAGGKQRTDSTHVVAAVAALSRLELAGESVRAVLEALAVAHPDWLGQRICVSDFARRYGTPMTSWHPPASQAKRDELAITYARDGYALLEAVYDSAAPAWLRELPAVDVLRRVLVQNYTRTITGGREVIKRREKEPEGDGLPPGHIRIASPYDTDARWGVKRDTFWLGYKLHVTETCDDPPPCSCRPGPAGQEPADGPGHDKGCAHLAFPEPDHARGHHRRHRDRHPDDRRRPRRPGRKEPGPRAALPRLGLPQRRCRGLGAGHLGHRADRPAARGHLRPGPRRQRLRPRGLHRRLRRQDRHLPARQDIRVLDGVRPARQERDRGHLLRRRLRPLPGPRPVHHRETTPAHADAPRPGRSPGRRPRRRKDDPVPRRLRPPRRRRGHQAASHGARRARYHGLPKTRLDHAYMACALNLLRLEAFWTGTPLDRQRTSHLARLELSLAT